MRGAEQRSNIVRSMRRWSLSKTWPDRVTLSTQGAVKVQCVKQSKTMWGGKPCMATLVMHVHTLPAWHFELCHRVPLGTRGAIRSCTSQTGPAGTESPGESS